MKSTEGLSLSGSTVTVSNNSLDQKTVTISDGYTLALAENVPKPSTTEAGWSLDGTNATYKSAETSAGYSLADNQITYTTASGGESLITVSGVKSTEGLSLSGSTVTVSNNSLDQKTVTINDGYTLALANEVPKPSTTEAAWTYSGNVATYKSAATSAGYSLDENQITYTAATGGESLITVSGVKSTEGLSLNGSTVTVGNNSLDQKTVTINNGYTIALANEVPKPSTTEAAWIYSDNVATYKSATTSEGYSLVDNQITYTESSGGENLITVNGVKSTEGLSLSGSTVTVSNNSLDQKTVTINNGYTLALAENVPKPSTTEATWTYSDNVATYKNATTSEGYSLADNQITYTTASGGENLITVNGVKSVEGLSLSGSTVTIDNAALNKQTVTISDGYTLALAEDVPKPSTIEAGWTYLNNVASYKSVATSEGYTLADNQINYVTAGKSKSLVTVNGVISADALDIDTTNKKVTVGYDSLAQKNVTVSDDYTIALGDDVPTPFTTSGWIFNNNKATYIAADTSAGYNVVDNEIVYSEKVTGSPQIILDGLAKNASLSNPADKVVTLNSTALGANSSLKANDGAYAVELTGKMNKKIFTGSDEDDTLNIAADNASVNGGSGNDYFYADGSEVTLTGGAGNDSFKLSGKNPMLTYSVGEGNDTVNFVEGMQLSLSGNTSIKALSKSGSDLMLGFGENSSIKITGVKSADTLKVISDSGSVTLDADKFDLANQLTFNSNNSSVQVAESFAGSLSPKDDIYLGGSKLSNVSTIDANNVTSAVTVRGNAKANTIIGGKNNDNIFGDDGNDSLFGNDGNDKIYGGAGNDTLNGGKGNDTLWGGDGKDVFIYEEGNNVIGDFTAGQDTIKIAKGKISKASLSSSDVIFAVGNDSITVKNAKGKTISLIDSAGKASSTVVGGQADIKSYDDLSSKPGENISNSKVSVTVAGTSGNDFIQNTGDNVTLAGLTGNDTIRNYGDLVTILGGKGKDSINNYGDIVLINGSEDNDSIRNNSGANVSIIGGKGDDLINLSGASKNNFIRYSLGDGNDTIWGFGEDDTLNILADGYDTIRSGNDIIVLIFGKYGIGSIRGYILLKNVANKQICLTLGESGTSGGNSGSNGGGGNSSSGSGGNGGSSGNGNGGGRSQGGTSSSEGKSSDASGGKSASGSSGGVTSGNSSPNGNGSNGSNIYENPFDYSEVAQVPAQNISSENPPAANTQSVNVAPEPTLQMSDIVISDTTGISTTASQQYPIHHIYRGNNQVISNYQSGENILFDETYTGSTFDDKGNFFAYSSTGTLLIENATDKFISLNDGNAYALLKIYTATRPSVIDGRNLEGFEIINGSDGSDVIYAGNGNSQLWGGNGFVPDTLVGGGGKDIFIGSKEQGSDSFLNVSSADEIQLSDVTLKDIMKIDKSDDKITISLKTGSTVMIQSSEGESGTIVFADTTWNFKHST